MRACVGVLADTFSTWPPAAMRHIAAAERADALLELVETHPPGRLHRL